MHLASKHRAQRSREIVDVLAASACDVVGLQEVWVRKDFDRLRAALPLYHAVYADRWIFGSGLAIFSRHPILCHKFVPFTTNGAPWRVLWGDWWAGKGVLMVLIDFCGARIAVFNAHLHATYKQESVLATRLVQWWEWRQMVEGALAMGCDGVIAVGDFNTSDDELPYTAFIRDGLCCTHRLSDIGGSACTHGLPTNTWSHQQPKRIDYIFTCNFDCLRFAATDVAGSTGRSLSDHCMLTADLQYSPKNDRHAAAASPKQAVQVVARGLNERKQRKCVFLLAAALLGLLAVGLYAFAIVSVFVDMARTLRLLLYICVPIAGVASLALFTLGYLHTREDVKAFENTINRLTA